ncbi:hypothetical protein Glove_100g25 [Diversispora epigaea]|uniref:Uncharacterized protein n=1 Tax=Diversispora epigaea TaxID=1348612 RepID=A0A397J3Y8_9GLOM|nr:hypothetical protein Glove_100g25 [Diversispora epigaea]
MEWVFFSLCWALKTKERFKKQAKEWLNNLKKFIKAKISLYDSNNNFNNNELASLPNVDFLFLHYSNKNLIYNEINYYKKDMIIEGKLEIAQFDNDNNNNYNNNSLSSCTLKPISWGIALLVIPFDKALNLGCNSIDDLISRNKWIIQDMTPSPIDNQTNEIKILYNGTYLIPNNNNSNNTNNNNALSNSSGIPQVIVFTSINGGGDPGVKEPINNFLIMQEARVGLTLLRSDDMNQIINLANQTTHVSVTSDVGPWVQLLKSKEWIACSIIISVIYCGIFLFSCGYFFSGSCNYEWNLKYLCNILLNPNLLILPGIAFCSISNFIDSS